MSNFEYLNQTPIFNEFSSACIKAEQALGLDTITSSILCRRALELAVKWLYANDNDLKIPYNDGLSALVHDITFKNIIDEKLLKQIEYIIKLGNFAVHNNKKVSREETILALKYLYNFTQWIAYCYSDKFDEKEFDENTLPHNCIVYNTLPEKLNTLKQLGKDDRKIEEVRRENKTQRDELTEKREKKKENYTFEIKDITEYQTRKEYIDLELKIAGWDFEKNIKQE